MKAVPYCSLPHSKEAVLAQSSGGAVQGSNAEMQAELDSLRQERGLLIDKLNNHPDVRKYAGRGSYLGRLPAVGVPVCKAESPAP